jgi:hypothetical protein
MPKQELLGEVKKLITIWGRKRASSPTTSLNSTLPAEVVSSDQFGTHHDDVRRDWTSRLWSPPKRRACPKKRAERGDEHHADDSERNRGGLIGGRKRESRSTSRPAHSAAPTTRSVSTSRRWAVSRC